MDGSEGTPVVGAHDPSADEPASHERRSRARAAALVGVPTLLWLLMFVEGTGPLDHALLVTMYAGHVPVLAETMVLLTVLGGGYFVTLVAAVAALALAMRSRPWAGFVFFVGSLLGRLLVEVQKYELNRVRPDANPHLVTVQSLSFPSGHSANAVMTYVAMVLLFVPRGRARWKWLAGAAFVSLIIGLSRVMLGVHWPSDVIGGWSFGLLWAVLMAWAAQHPPSWAVRR